MIIMEISLLNIPIHNFKVGDTVTVIKKIERWAYGRSHSNSWVAKMDVYLGKQHRIQSIGSTGCRLCGVGECSSSRYTFAFESLCKYLPNEQLLLFELV